MDTYQSGTYAEMLFTAECIRYGHIVSTPLMQSAVYDCLVETEKGIFKVQVKCSNFFIENVYRFNVVKRIGDGSVGSYDIHDMDFVALYVVEYRGFFIIPYLHTQRTFRVSLTNKYSNYFNNFAFDFLP